MNPPEILSRLGLSDRNSGVFAEHWVKKPRGPEWVSLNPATGEPIASVMTASRDDYHTVVETASRSFRSWRSVPPPARGEIIRRFGDALRRHRDDLGMMVTLESGKILAEGIGEVQEMIDMCDFAVGLSRQLYGLTISSERAEHRMFEQWHPLGPIGIITAFNFPVAVWAWNAAIAAVCGNTMIWKPSPETPLTAIAVQKIAEEVSKMSGASGVFNLCIGDLDSVGEPMIADPRLPLISATGSCRMGTRVAEVVGRRLGRSLLELGGNNAAIVTENADVDLALRGVVFAAVGTAGQRCTTLRRLILHEAIADRFLLRLRETYANIRIGDPWDEKVLMGPLIHEPAVEAMQSALQVAREQGGVILMGGRPLDRPGFFVEPAIVRADHKLEIVREETFAPILYVMTYRDLDEAIAVHNDVPQGLSSSIFTESLRESERFLSAMGSDCGIANVNLGTSGAEIGGAFGGEKASGGGREAGSDAWKAYMRRQTCTVNYGQNLPLSQGVRFELSRPAAASDLT